MIRYETSRSLEPLDIVEHVVSAENYPYERTHDDEVHFCARGDWGDHAVWFGWSEPTETLHICVALDVTIPDTRRRELCELLALLNERLWMGHFDLWSDDDALVYRHALALPGGGSPDHAQIAAMIASALEAGERFYPAVHMLLREGRSPLDSVAAALFETAGEA